jgi:hypothetical protein
VVAESIAQRHEQLVEGSQFCALSTDEPMQSGEVRRLTAQPSSLKRSQMIIQLSLGRRMQIAEEILVVLRLPRFRIPTGKNRIDDRDQAAHGSPPILRLTGVASMRTR